MAGQAGSVKLHFLVLFILISSLCLRVQCLQEYYGNCDLTIDLMMTQNVQSGLLKFPLPESMAEYQNPAFPKYCQVMISFTSGMNLLLELYYLDIMPKSGDLKACSTGLEIFDQTGRKYYGGRLCMEGWAWEERHREKQQEKVVVQNSPLTLRLVSEGPYRGEGFRLHFNQFRPYWPCYIREFKCQQIQRCVHDDVTCDGWDDCGDYSDERIEAGCDLLTASEICALIIGVLLLLGSVAEVVIFLITYRRFSKEYGVRSESKIPIAEEKYNMEPVLGRQYNSQDSIPSRYSRSTAPKIDRRDSYSDIIDKADLERADRQELEPLTGVRNSNRTGDNMSERSYRSNPRRTLAQNLGTETATDPVKKSGQYSYSSRKGLNSSQSSLVREKVEPPLNGFDNNGGLDKEKFGSRDRLSDRDRKYGRDRDRYSDSDDDYDRRRRSSRERSRRRSGRYSDDDDSDYDRDRDYRRRSRRRYSDDSYDSDYEYERERERRRRSRERYNRERYDQDGSDADKDPGQDNEKDKDRSSSRRDSRERKRDRDRYSRDRNNGEDDTDKGRDQERDSKRDKDRERYRDSYDDDDYDDRRPRRRRSGERRRGPSAERDRLSVDLSRNEKKSRSRSRENLPSREKDRRSPPLSVLPPPYTAEDARRVEQQNLNQSSLGDGKKNTEQQIQPPPSFDPPKQKVQQYPSADDRKHNAEQIPKPSSDIKYPEQQSQKPPPPVADAKRTDQQNLKSPSSGADLKHLESQNQRPPPKEVNEADRRRSTDDRRERYSRGRWTPKKKSEDLPPPEYEDVAPPKSTFVGISYKEESV